MTSLFTQLYKTIFIVLSFLFFVFGKANAQFSLDKTDFHRVTQKKVRFYIANQIQNNVHFISDIKPSIQKGQDVSSYWTHEKVFEIKNDIHSVWQKYSSVDLRKIWNKKPVTFGLLLSKKNNKAIYRNDPFEGVEVGQVYYLNLQFLRGVYNMAVAFEILTFDREKRIIEFSYINDGIAKGMQTITFIESNNGETKIIHNSLFKSNSNFRDKYLYPLFHKKFINEFHNSVNS
jgi:hypothetical protein